ncbi:MAG: glycosyltransferase family 2 protein [Pseudomonadota bacterium]
MPTVSVVMPVYNVERYVAASIQSVLDQTFTDFELLIVDDGGTDESLTICQKFDDPRIKIIRQRNRGLAGARNTGIRHAKGQYIALLDSDDLWKPEKLAKHVEHLDNSPKVGISFSSSAFIDDNGEPLGIYQLPKLTSINAIDVLCRNPVGNGSAPVIRRAVFEELALLHYLQGEEESAFDESFRQSEDIECWVRMTILTQWQFEGLSEDLTLYRVNAGGLSSNLENQYASWGRMIEKARRYAPYFLEEWEARTRSYQLRYLARRAIRMRNAPVAVRLVHRAIATDYKILFQEPARTIVTLMAAYALFLLPKRFYRWLEERGMAVASMKQKRLLNKSLSPLTS